MRHFFRPRRRRCLDVMQRAHVPSPKRKACSAKIKQAGVVFVYFLAPLRRRLRWLWTSLEGIFRLLPRPGLLRGCKRDGVRPHTHDSQQQQLLEKCISPLEFSDSLPGDGRAGQDAWWSLGYMLCSLVYGFVYRCTYPPLYLVALGFRPSCRCRAKIEWEGQMDYDNGRCHCRIALRALLAAEPRQSERSFGLLKFFVSFFHFGKNLPNNDQTEP